MGETRVFERPVAQRVLIKTLLDGTISSEGAWSLAKLTLPNGRVIQSVDIVATIVDIQDDGVALNLLLDDGSAKIPVRIFGINRPNASVGSIVHVLGKPRDYNGERYIMSDAAKVVTNPAFLSLRALQIMYLERQRKDTGLSAAPVVNAAAPKPQENLSAKESPRAKILDMIRAFDIGEGADIERIVVESNISDAESIIKESILRGDIFEVRPGRVKIIE